MPGTTAITQRPITEQIEDLKAKIALLDGDRKAYLESAEFCKKQNREKILSLRKETNELRKSLSDKLRQDEHVIEKALNDKPAMRAALSSKTGRQAVEIYDHKVSDSQKRLNAMRHQTAQREKKLAELKTLYEQQQKDAAEAVATDKGESHDAQTMRYLENSYDKVVMKCEEAKQVKRVYFEIKSKFVEEAQTYPRKLDAMEAEIARTKGEMKQLEAMKNDAEQAKASSQSELSQQEDHVYSERKKREIELQRMKKEAEEKKMQHERIEKRLAQRASLQGEDLSAQEKAALTGEEQQHKITTYEEAFRRIKEATGVSDTMEVVERFKNQDSTKKHLEELQTENNRTILRLREDKDKLNQEFEEMKYSGDAKLSSGQAILEDFESHLSKEEDRRDDADEKLQRGSKILVQVKAGVEHLADKLHHLKASKGHVPTAQINASSDEYVLDQLSTSEEKLLKLLEELDGKDLNDTLKQMEEEDFHASIEGKLPTYNTRIKLPQTQRDLVYEDDDDSGEDDWGVPTRVGIKNQSALIIDSKTKRRTLKKKKKTK